MPVAFCAAIWTYNGTHDRTSSLEATEGLSILSNHDEPDIATRPIAFGTGEPDKELNPKKKVWEQVQPDLRTDDQCVATYKGAAFEVAGKGVCKAQTMSNSGIK